MMDITTIARNREVQEYKAQTARRLVAAGALGAASIMAVGAVTPAQAATVVVTSSGTATSGEAAAEVCVGASQVEEAQVQVAEVKGIFSATQEQVTPNDEIARSLGGADKVLCSGSSGTTTSGSAATGSTTSGDESAVDAAAWEISISGDGVSSPLDATIGELATTISQSQLMGCSCLGNPADGRASVNADVTGIDLRSALELAGVSDEANEITFTCADGYQVSLPLSYVLQRKSLIVYEVGGEPLSQSMGGTNQLWLGSTAARYFASDIVSIEVSCVDDADVPAAPGSAAAADTAANVPNVALMSAKNAA